MAEDIVMLEAFQERESIRFRHYEWSEEDSVTFGYFQHWKQVKAQTGRQDEALCRRPTGGGLVDHANDWTYSLVIPPSHKLYREKACKVYRAIHEQIAGALRKQRVGTSLEEDHGDCGGRGLVCFEKASPGDVIETASGMKIAGAAQKRSKLGLLTQGSVSKDRLGGVNWEVFYRDFMEGLHDGFECHEPEGMEGDDAEALIREWEERLRQASWRKRR